MERARAFVPGHLTGFFTVERGDDPTKAGSTGAGVTLTDGVGVEVVPADERAVLLDGDRVEMAAVERVLDTLEARAVVRATTPLPVGAGFGVSGALALGTALAANAAFERELSENELVTVAHGAEVEAGTGLGDVVAQARGGVPVRLEPGGPHHGVLDGVPDRGSVEYVVFGELSTADVVEGDTDDLSAAGEEALSRLVSRPTLPQFMYASRRFAREAELLTDDVHRAIRDVNEAGGDAAMGMLGRTVFALGSGLSDAGYDASRCEVDPAGARLLE